jgi:tetratricopeptide (TPR) repeat protein
VLKDRLHFAIALGVFVFVLVMYALTVQNTVPFWDSGEFIATSYVLGVPHPPGTPLYVLIGRLATLIPIGSIATRVNFLSSLASAFAVLLTYLITVKLILAMWKAPSRQEKWVAFVGGVVASIFMAFSSSFWDSAVEAEVYNVSSAGMLLCLWMGLRWRESLSEEGSDIPLVFVAYVCFLAIGIHLGTLLVLPPLVLFVLLVRWRSALNARFLSVVAVLAVVGISVHLYLLIRASLNPSINEADPSTWGALWKVLTRDQYKPPSIFERRAPFWFQLNHMYFRYFLEQFRTGLPGNPAVVPIVLGALGAAGQYLRDKKGFVLMFSLFLITSIGLVIYLNFSTDEVRERDYFFIASYHLFCVWIGVGSAMIVKTAAFRLASRKGEHEGRWWLVWGEKGELASRAALLLAGAIVLFLSFLPLIKGNQFFLHDRKNNFVARDYAYNMLEPLDQDAILFTNGDNDTFPLWYLQDVEGVRKDVRVVNLSLLNTGWYIKQLRDEEPRVPISFTDAQIDRLMPIRDRTGRIVLVKDFAVQNILATNKWKRPVFMAVTVADQMDLQTRLIMEGLNFRVVPDEAKGTRVNVEKTLKNLYEVYRYDGLLDESGAYMEKPYKDENTRNLIQNYCAAHTYAAHSLMRDNRLPEALREFEAAKAISPWYSGIIISLGELYEQMGAVDKAIEHYKEMLQYHPRDARVYYKLGTLLNKSGRYAEAEQYLKAGIARMPDVYYLRSVLAEGYSERGMTDKVQEVLEEWLQRHPDDKKIRDYLRRQASTDTT